MIRTCLRTTNTCSPRDHIESNAQQQFNKREREQNKVKNNTKTALLCYAKKTIIHPICGGKEVSKQCVIRNTNIDNPLHVSLQLNIM